MPSWIDEDLEALRRADRFRVRRPPPHRDGPWLTDPSGIRLLDLCSNDYLGLGAEPLPPLDVPASAAASRLVSGDLDVHAELEHDLATWLHAERTLLFTSGYAANVGVLQALGGPDTVLFSDALNHASIIDGCRLSRARTVVVPHRDLEALQRALAAAPERRRVVVSDSHFSMDGDLAPVAALRALCDRHDALLVLDEAHALGVFGPEGRGVAAAAGVRPDLLVGTLGKALGAGGAFVATDTPLHDWLWNRARSLVFSTGLAPVLAGLARHQLPHVRDGLRTERLRHASESFRAALFAAGVTPLAESVGPIVPVVLGTERRALDAAQRLRTGGLHVHPIRPPTVPVGTSRLRLTVRADHPIERYPAIAEAIAKAVR